MPPPQSPNEAHFTMKNTTTTTIIKTLLIGAIILSASAHFFPWGETTAIETWNIQYYHWGGIMLSIPDTDTSELILFPTNLSNATNTPDTYGYAAATLLLYLMIPLGIGSFTLGLLALFRPNKKKRSFQATLTSFITILLFILFMIFGINPRLESGIAGFTSDFHWATGFYLMILAALFYLAAFIFLKKYPLITPNKEKIEKKI